MSHERNTADERYDSVIAFFDSGGPTVGRPYGIAYSGRLTGALTIQKGGLRKLDELEAVIVTKDNTSFVVQRDGTVLKENETVGSFEYAFRLGEGND